MLSKIGRVSATVMTEMKDDESGVGAAMSWWLQLTTYAKMRREPVVVGCKDGRQKRMPASKSSHDCRCQMPVAGGHQSRQLVVLLSSRDPNSWWWPSAAQRRDQQS